MNNNNVNQQSLLNKLNLDKQEDESKGNLVISSELLSKNEIIKYLKLMDYTFNPNLPRKLLVKVYDEAIQSKDNLNKLLLNQGINGVNSFNEKINNENTNNLISDTNNNNTNTNINKVLAIDIKDKNNISSKSQINNVNNNNTNKSDDNKYIQIILPNDLEEKETVIPQNNQANNTIIKNLDKNNSTNKKPINKEGRFQDQNSIRNYNSLKDVSMISSYEEQDLNVSRQSLQLLAEEINSESNYYIKYDKLTSRPRSLTSRNPITNEKEGQNKNSDQSNKNNTKTQNNLLVNQEKANNYNNNIESISNNNVGGKVNFKINNEISYCNINNSKTNNNDSIDNSKNYTKFIDNLKKGTNKEIRTIKSINNMNNIETENNGPKGSITNSKFNRFPINSHHSKNSSQSNIEIISSISSNNLDINNNNNQSNESHCIFDNNNFLLDKKAINSFSHLNNSYHTGITNNNNINKNNINNYVNPLLSNTTNPMNLNTSGNTSKPRTIYNINNHYNGINIQNHPYNKYKKDLVMFKPNHLNNFNNLNSSNSSHHSNNSFASNHNNCSNAGLINKMYNSNGYSINNNTNIYDKSNTPEINLASINNNYIPSTNTNNTNTINTNLVNESFTSKLSKNYPLRLNFQTVIEMPEAQEQTSKKQGNINFTNNLAKNKANNPFNDNNIKVKSDNKDIVETEILDSLINKNNSNNRLVINNINSINEFTNIHHEEILRKQKEDYISFLNSNKQSKSNNTTTNIDSNNNFNIKESRVDKEDTRNLNSLINDSYANYNIYSYSNQELKKGFIAFARVNRSFVLKKNPNITYSDLVASLKQLWNSLSQRDKDNWVHYAQNSSINDVDQSLVNDNYDIIDEISIINERFDKIVDHVCEDNRNNDDKDNERNTKKKIKRVGSNYKTDNIINKANSDNYNDKNYNNMKEDMSMYLKKALQNNNSNNNSNNTNTKLEVFKIDKNTNNTNNLDDANNISNSSYAQKSSIGNFFKIITSTCSIAAMIFGAQRLSDNADLVTSYFNQDRLHIVNGIIVDNYDDQVNDFLSNNWYILAGFLIVIIIFKLVSILGSNIIDIINNRKYNRILSEINQSNKDSRDKKEDCDNKDRDNDSHDSLDSINNNYVNDNDNESVEVTSNDDINSNDVIIEDEDKKCSEDIIEVKDDENVFHTNAY